MAGIGSVFLGDVQRHRVFSTSTPPSSPPGSSIYTGIPSSPPIEGSREDDDEDSVEDDDTETMDEAVAPSKVDANPPKATTIDPILALELRLRWLEALVLGLPENNPSRAASHRKLGSVPLRKKLLKHGETLVRLAKDVQSRLDAIVDANEGLKRFMAQYDQHEGALQAAPEYANMTPEEFEALLQEMEPDIRAADRDMREIEFLERKGVAGAGKLADYENLQPRLEALVKAHKEHLELVASLERSIATLMNRNATQVDALSELFVAWDDTLTEAEDKITRLEREKAERLRLGLENDT